MPACGSQTQVDGVRPAPSLPAPPVPARGKLSGRKDRPTTDGSLRPSIQQPPPSTQHTHATQARADTSVEETRPSGTLDSKKDPECPQPTNIHHPTSPTSKPHLSSSGHTTTTTTIPPPSYLLPSTVLYLLDRSLLIPANKRL